MKFIKHEKHGIIQVHEITPVQKEHGWKVINLEDEIKKEPVKDIIDIKPIDDMTKSEVEEYGRELGVELDKRKTKANMLKDLEEWLQSDLS